MSNQEDTERPTTAGHCEDANCEGYEGFTPELPLGSRYCPFCGNELVSDTEIAMCNNRPDRHVKHPDDGGR